MVQIFFSKGHQADNALEVIPLMTIAKEKGIKWENKETKGTEWVRSVTYKRSPQVECSL